MEITLSVIKADIGSIGGHLAPSRQLLETVRDHVEEQGRDLIVSANDGNAGDSG